MKAELIAGCLLACSRSWSDNRGVNSLQILAYLQTAKAFTT